MAKFMLARGQRIGDYPGLKMVEREGGLPPVQNTVYIKFAAPMKAVDVDDDIDMSGWVTSGHLVEVREPKPKPKPEVEEPPEPPIALPPEPPKAPEPPKEPDPPEDDEEDDAEEENGEENGEPDYDEIKVGGKTKFKCLHCGHTLATEKGIIDHVEDKHYD
jgi:hypothetical protein